MSVLGEDAKFINTPPPHPFLLSLLAEAPLWLFRLLPVHIFFPVFSLLPNTKGACSGSVCVALLKCEGLSGSALIETSVSLTKREIQGNEGQVCVMASSLLPLKVTQHCWPVEV